MKYELKWRKKGEKCETKYGVVEEIQNQNGVVVFSNLEDATSRFSEVGHEQYWIFITHVSII